MDFFKNRNSIAFWSALLIALVEIGRQAALGDYHLLRSAIIDFGAVFISNLLIWHFNFLVDDYQSKVLGSVSHRSTAFRFLLTFLTGAAIVVSVESIVHHFFRDEGSKLLFYFMRGVFHNIVILVTYFAMQNQRRRQHLEVENVTLKEENVQVQLDILRQQVQPHFLFNALNTLKSMVKTNDPEAANFVVHLSSVYRYLLQSSMKQQATVEEELDLLRSYAFLLKTRFGDNFHLNIQLHDRILTTRMPPLTFQLLLENAVKHNVVSMDKPLHIEVFCPDDRHVAMRNNLQPKKSVEEGSGTGLENINRRYELLTGNGIEVEKGADWFLVKMPII